MRQVKLFISCGALSAVVQAASDDLTHEQRFHKKLRFYQANIDKQKADRLREAEIRNRRQAHRAQKNVIEDKDEQLTEEERVNLFKKYLEQPGQTKDSMIDRFEYDGNVYTPARRMRIRRSKLGLDNIVAISCIKNIGMSMR